MVAIRASAAAIWSGHPLGHLIDPGLLVRDGLGNSS